MDKKSAIQAVAFDPQTISPFIYWIRDEKVLLDRDLARLYGVETRVLKQAVRRNKERFPNDFMFQLTDKELDKMVSQNVIPNKGLFGGAPPMAFTEQGVAMLSSVLRSKRAIEVNIAIMRTFVQLRRFMASNKSLAEKINTLEKKYDEQFSVIFKAIKQLITLENKPRREMGFHTTQTPTEK